MSWSAKCNSTMMSNSTDNGITPEEIPDGGRAELSLVQVFGATALPEKCATKPLTSTDGSFEQMVYPEAQVPISRDSSTMMAYSFHDPGQQESQPISLTQMANQTTEDCHESISTGFLGCSVQQNQSEIYPSSSHSSYQAQPAYQTMPSDGYNQNQKPTTLHNLLLSNPGQSVNFQAPSTQIFGNALNAICPECRVDFKRAAILNFHLAFKTEICEQCNRKFCNKQLRNDHIVTDHKRSC